MTREYLVLFGSNIDPLKNLARAQQHLRDHSRMRLVGVSHAYESAAVVESGDHDRDKPAFVNAAFLIQSGSSVDEFTMKLREIEANLGRVRSDDKYADRQVDLDIIAYINDETLVTVDEDAWAYGYAVIPSADIVPEWRVGAQRLPLGQLAEIQINCNGDVRRLL